MAYNKTTWENAPSTNTPINANNLNKIEEGIYQNSLKADQVGTMNNLKTTEKSLLVNAINEIYDDIYYKDNDTFEIHEDSSHSVYNRPYTSGLITGVGKTLVFSLYLPKSIKNISSITVNELKMNVRNANGSYIEYNTYVAGGKDWLTSTYVHTIEKVNDNIITIVINKANDTAMTNATNNAPQTLEIDNITLTFSV